MTSRERILAAIMHQTPDRVPSTMQCVDTAWEKLIKYFGIKTADEVQDILDIDTRIMDLPPYISPEKPPFINADGDMEYTHPLGYRYINKWNGVEYNWHMVHFPYEEIETWEQFEAFDKWTDPDWFDYSAVKDFCDKHEGRAIRVGWPGPYQVFTMMYPAEKFYENMMEEPELIKALQFVLKGLMYIYTGGAELSIGRDYALNELLNSAVGPLPFSLYFVITTAAIFLVWIFLRFTRTGRNIYMVGGNVETAWLAGIKSRSVTTLAFVISSTGCALGGALNGIYSGAASITMGEKGISPLMIALTATIIGGTSLSGGKGSVVWTWVSLIAISFLKSLFKKTEQQVLVIAAILMLCIVYETLAQYKRSKVVGTRPNLHNEHMREIGKA